VPEGRTQGNSCSINAFFSIFRVRIHVLQGLQRNAWDGISRQESKDGGESSRPNLETIDAILEQYIYTTSVAHENAKRKRYSF